MTLWVMLNPSTNELKRVLPDEFWQYWKLGFRPVADRSVNGIDYQTRKVQS